MNSLDALSSARVEMLRGGLVGRRPGGRPCFCRKERRNSVLFRKWAFSNYSRGARSNGSVGVSTPGGEKIEEKRWVIPKVQLMPHAASLQCQSSAGAMQHRGEASALARRNPNYRCDAQGQQGVFRARLLLRYGQARPSFARSDRAIEARLVQ